jgi:heat shock protein HslJ/membrane-bound inhibitor of C-type lysozyme
MQRILFSAGVSILALAACADEHQATTPQPRQDTPVFTAYQCGALAVKFDHTSGELKVGEESAILSAVASASGAKYVGPDRTMFWSKGDRALLTFMGKEYPECVERGTQADASGGEILHARGNEPGWSLDLGSSTYKFTGDYGEVVVGGATPSPEILPDGLAYQIPGNELMIQVADRLCHDDATGAPFPKRVTVSLGDKTYRGCGGESVGLLIGEWRITHVAGASMSGSPASIGFDSEKVFGNTGCNRYSGSFELTPERLTIGPVVATERACIDDALLAAERKLLDQLPQLDRFDIAEDGSLVLYAADREAIRARR